mmetsp:Transcript_18018/g.49046  ORF Transcript_18018/g.49046 Transcript_18018/m.49046 type:complete len:222 (-) Transcript_18018:35-700(-)
MASVAPVDKWKLSAADHLAVCVSSYQRGTRRKHPNRASSAKSESRPQQELQGVVVVVQQVSPAGHAPLSKTTHIRQVLDYTMGQFYPLQRASQIPKSICRRSRSYATSNSLQKVIVADILIIRNQSQALCKCHLSSSQNVPFLPTHKKTKKGRQYQPTNNPHYKMQSKPNNSIISPPAPQQHLAASTTFLSSTPTVSAHPFVCTKRDLLGRSFHLIAYLYY